MKKQTPDYTMEETEAGDCNNSCLHQWYARNRDCLWRAIIGNKEYAPFCKGHGSGKELDHCMSTCWTPSQLRERRSQDSKPFDSELGDQCFDEFVGRIGKIGWTDAANKAEWMNCLTTVP
jgi:hypothetical protein